MVPDGGGSTGHPGAAAPHDYLLLDLFTMPGVEPYAISEPFSTAGKINLNQRIVPFLHITRETGLRGVLKNLEILAVPSDNDTITQTYSTANTDAAKWQEIRPLDVTRTLEKVAKVLDPGRQTGAGAFRSAAQICDIFFFPDDIGSLAPADYWKNRQLTPDNARETPYNFVYPLLTTKSNTYQVHYRVQSLTPLRTKTNFDPKNDFKTTGEQRGSYLIERVLDANDQRFNGTGSDAVDTDTTPLDKFHQFRQLRHSRFTQGA